jgi:hypothetical protein
VTGSCSPALAAGTKTTPTSTPRVTICGPDWPSSKAKPPWTEADAFQATEEVTLTGMRPLRALTVLVVAGIVVVAARTNRRPVPTLD